MGRRKFPGGRKKASPGKYGKRLVGLSAKLSPEAKQGLKDLAEKFGLSLNEFLEMQGRGLLLPSLPSGESSAS